MGNLIDRNPKTIYRCKDVKETIIFINLIGAPISFIFLLFGSLRMTFAKKKISFLTSLILLIFSSEIVNTISKMLQLFKYIFEDKRDNKGFRSGNTPRGIICQIQIVTAIYSDYCSLLGTLLLSLRCYDVIKNKKRFFDKGKNGIISIILTVIISLVLSILFLLIDKLKTRDNISYRYDVRDRCSYWCWLEHIPSLICFGFYWVILVFNIIYACKTGNYLKRGYKKLLEDNEIPTIKGKNSSLSTPLNDIPKDNYKQINEKKLSNLTKEEKKRIEELRIMRYKCLIYPLVTIILWLFIGTYRIVDDSMMMKYDDGKNATRGTEKEEEDFKNNGFALFLVEFFLVIHTFLSSTRGILYGFSFIVFEEKIFFNFFRKCFKKYYFENDEENSEEEEQKKEIIRITNNNSEISDSCEKEEIDKEESQNENIEMNNSDYNYND